MSPFGPDDYIDLGLIDLDETDADRAAEPLPGCCEDCDGFVEVAAITAQFQKGR